MSKNFKEMLSRYHFTDELGHALENCVDYQELLAAARPKPLMRFATDDDCHNYLIPVEKYDAFVKWLEHQAEMWEPDLSEEDFKRIGESYQGEDFNGCRINSPEGYAFENPQEVKK